jgi:Ca2+-binding EF-hand superfamily protein
MNTHRNLTYVGIAFAVAGAVVSTALAGTDADKHFKMMDANGDGKITRAEHAAAAKQMFKQCDANHDGVVTVAEMDAASAAKGEKPGKDEKSSTEKIRVIDQNGDGKLTAAEHATGTETMFGKMDRNGDGVLSKDECEAGMKMLQKGADGPKSG